jgi:hypothetical protein
LAGKSGRKLIIVVQTAIVFWRASAIPKPQMPVIPPEPRLAKVGIEPIALIDDVDRRRGARQCPRGSGCALSLDFPQTRQYAKPDHFPPPISISPSAVFWFLFWFEW